MLKQNRKELAFNYQYIRLFVYPLLQIGHFKLYIFLSFRSNSGWECSCWSTTVDQSDPCSEFKFNTNNNYRITQRNNKYYWGKMDYNKCLRWYHLTVTVLVLQCGSNLECNSCLWYYQCKLICWEHFYR